MMLKTNWWGRNCTQCGERMAQYYRHMPPSKGNASRHVAYAKGSVMTTRMRVDELKLGDLYVLLFEYSVPLRSIKAIRVSSAGGGGLKHDDTQSCLN